MRESTRRNIQKLSILSHLGGGEGRRGEGEEEKGKRRKKRREIS